MIYHLSPPDYRHEHKYFCNAKQNAILKTKARGLLKPDRHTGEGGFYSVRSLYFDSFEDETYFDNEDGAGIRDKYRIRIYNADTAGIFLEKKSKRRQMIAKRSCQIDEGLCQSLIRGRYPCPASGLAAEQRFLLDEMQRRSLRPVVIVEYIRYPFVETAGNVRVTFDEQISSSNDVGAFLEKKLLTRPVLESGSSVIEVKWDGFLPGHIKSHIEMEYLRRSRFSKYTLCRRYNTYGGVRV